MRPLVNASRDPQPGIERHTLTPRERQIVDCVAAGLSNRQISSSLGINEQTVKNRLTGIFNKMGVTSRLQLALRATSREQEGAVPSSSASG